MLHNVKSSHKGAVGTGQIELPDDLDSLIDAFDEKLVFVHAIRSIVTSYRNWIASQVRAEKTQEEIDEASSVWKPVAEPVRAKKSKTEKAKALLSKMSDDERQEALAELQNMLLGDDE